MLLPKLYLLRSRASPEEVLRRVRLLVEPPPRGGLSYCEGAVTGDSFAVRRRGADGAPGPVRLTGEVAPEGSGALLRLRFRVTGGALLGLLLLGLLMGTALALVLRHRGAPTTAPELLAVAAALTGAVAFTFRLGWEKARLVRLAGYLNGEQDATWLEIERAGSGR